MISAWQHQVRVNEGETLRLRIEDFRTSFRIATGKKNSAIGKRGRAVAGTRAIEVWAISEGGGRGIKDFRRIKTANLISTAGDEHAAIGQLCGCVICARERTRSERKRP